MGSPFEAQFDNAMDTLRDVHSDVEPVVFTLSGAREPFEVHGVTIIDQAETDAATDTTRQTERRRELLFSIKSLPRTPMKGDQCKLPGLPGNWHYRQTLETVGQQIRCEWTQPVSVRHGGTS